MEPLGVHRNTDQCLLRRDEHAVGGYSEQEKWNRKRSEFTLA